MIKTNKHDPQRLEHYFRETGVHFGLQVGFGTIVVTSRTRISGEKGRLIDRRNGWLAQWQVEEEKVSCKRR